MKISQFDDERPKKTYECIIDLQEYVNKRMDLLEQTNTINYDLYMIKTKLNTLKKYFLSGE